MTGSWVCWGCTAQCTQTCAVAEADLLIALGVRFDDRVTGKLEEFAKHAKIIHVDIDASEINKNKEAHLPIVADVKRVLTELNEIVEPPEDISDWVRQCHAWKEADPLKYDEDYDGILQQHAIDLLSDLTGDRDTYITVGVGQHQMWAAQFYKFNRSATVAFELRAWDDGVRSTGSHGSPGRSSRCTRDRH